MTKHAMTTSVAMALLLTASSPAYAYLDAGTGSIMIQAIFGSIAGAMLFGRAYIAKVKAFFTRSKSSTSSDVE